MKTIPAILKKNTLKINAFSLKNAEKMILQTINKTEDLQKTTSKTIKRSFNFTEKQQDNFFKGIEKTKGLGWKNIHKTLDFFSKN